MTQVPLYKSTATVLGVPSLLTARHPRTTPDRLDQLCSSCSSAPAQSRAWLVGAPRARAGCTATADGGNAWAMRRWALTFRAAKARAHHHRTAGRGRGSRLSAAGSRGPAKESRTGGGIRSRGLMLRGCAAPDTGGWGSCRVAAAAACRPARACSSWSWSLPSRLFPPAHSHPAVVYGGVQI